MLVALRRLPFWSLVLLSGTGYLILAFWFPLIPNHNHAPLPDIFALAPALWQGVAYGLLLTLLFVLYGLAWEQMTVANRPVRTIWLAATLFVLILLFVFPINATDLYRYFIRGRVASVYGLSPYLFSPDQVADPYLPLAGEWQSYTSPYGPLWEMVAYLVTLLARWLAPAQWELLAGLLFFKLLTVGLFFGSGYLLVRNRPDQAEKTLLLWLWNPALLLSFAVNGHNDSLMLFLFVLGWYWVSRERPYLAWLFFVLAPLSKPIGVLALPFLFIFLWRRPWPSRGSAWRFFGLSGLISLGVGWLLFAPFGSPWDLAVRLVAESTSFLGFSPVTLVVLSRNRRFGPQPYSDMTNGALLLFVLTVLYLLWRAWRGRSPLRGAADCFGFYLLQAASFRIWYAVWLWPWLLLDDGVKSGRRRLAGVLFLYLSQLSVIIYAHVRIHLFARDQLWAHAVAIPLIFVVPLSVLWGGGRNADGAD